MAIKSLIQRYDYTNISGSASLFRARRVLTFGFLFGFGANDVRFDFTSPHIESQVETCVTIEVYYWNGPLFSENDSSRFQAQPWYKAALGSTCRSGQMTLLDCSSSNSKQRLRQE